MDSHAARITARRFRGVAAAILALALSCGTAWALGGGHAGGFGGGGFGGGGHIGGGFGGGHPGGGFGGGVGHPGGGGGGGHYGGDLGAGNPGGFHGPTYLPGNRGFAGYGRYPYYLNHRHVILPYVYVPYGGYDPYEPGVPYYALCDQYSAYYDPRYCY
jgi:hypothetical protein